MLHPRMRAVLAMSALLAGCHNHHDALEARAAAEFSCPENDVIVQELGAGAYRVWACGWFVQYVCSNSGGMTAMGYVPGSTTCVRETQPVRYK